ncbi:unnamed protein product [Ilex paraguariensis]|uniref:Cytochrome P450 n=1 Tax=Ilex paraguariensis TaxID=185542 RepID=A0ABC8QXN4_9AQUA
MSINSLSSQPLVFSILSIFLLYFLINWLFTNPSTKINLPPSPPKLPIIGHLHKLGLYPHLSLQTLAQKHGPLMRLQLGSKQTLVVSSADAAIEIMKTHDLIFANRPKSHVNKKLLYDFKDLSVAPYGEYWRQLKSICMLNLLGAKKVQSIRAVREEETALLVKKITEESSSSSSGEVDLSVMFMTLTNDVICRTAFGKKYSGGESGRKFRKMISEFVGVLGGFDVGTFIPRLAWVNHITGFNAKVDRIAKELDDFLEGVVEEHSDPHKRGSNHGERIEGEGRDDFVDVLLGIYKNNKGAAGFSLDRDSIKALILVSLSLSLCTEIFMLHSFQQLNF